MLNLFIVIPAIKKNAIIPDQLIKKLDGVTLIQRAINTALSLTSSQNILILTDSQEISLISERNDINFHYDKELVLNSDNIIQITNDITSNITEKDFLIYRANAPLITSQLLIDAYNKFCKKKSCILTSVKEMNKSLFSLDSAINICKDTYFEEIKAFIFFNKDHLPIESTPVLPYVIDNEKSIEIESYQNWWVCEKILQRKRIVFNVIGSTKIGMGHIYHSLALAHEITDHEIIFVCDESYQIAVDKIASADYKVISTKDIQNTIINLEPDIVINDILNTSKDYIKQLKTSNIKVVNFEDLGEGSKYADLVFNELYDVPQLEGDNYLWGYEYLALRDEFFDAIPHKFVKNIDTILITFGGTDPNNLTLLSLKSILKTCQHRNIKIYIVCGSGYLFKDTLETYLHNLKYKNIELTYASGVISKIMEKTQIAISSNGRTVYELADMNIPSIVISHHEREATHCFANLARGFINLGIVNKETDKHLLTAFLKIITDTDYRELLFMNIEKYTFRKNKQKVVKKIMDLLHGK